MPDNNFRKAFSSAKKKGQKTFTYEGKRYTTQTASEKAKKMSPSQLKKARNESYDIAKSSSFKSKSRNEVSESYTRESQYRKGDKLEKMGLDPRKYSDRMKGNFKGSANALKRPNKKK